MIRADLYIECARELISVERDAVTTHATSECWRFAEPNQTGMHAEFSLLKLLLEVLKPY